MGAVTLTSDWPPPTGPLTVADLERTPDDGRRYELVDGVLIASPAPLIAHQVALHALEVLMDAALPEDLAIVPGTGLWMSDINELVPDLVVVRREQLAGRKLTSRPTLVVEVRSASTALFDMNTKKAVYERFGVPSYWIVVPDRDKPEILAFELRDGRYEQVAHVTGDDEFSSAHPFPLSVIPSELVARLPRE